MGPLTERGYRVLAFDFYGFGWSTANDGATYNADLFVQQAYGACTFGLRVRSSDGDSGHRALLLLHCVSLTLRPHRYHAWRHEQT